MLFFLIIDMFFFTGSHFVLHDDKQLLLVGHLGLLGHEEIFTGGHVVLLDLRHVCTSGSFVLFDHKQVSAGGHVILLDHRLIFIYSRLSCSS